MAVLLKGLGRFTYIDTGRRENVTAHAITAKPVG
jgi:hypothetical protein